MQSDIDRVGKDKPKKEMARCWINYAMDQIYGEFIREGKSGLMLLVAGAYHR